jgi:hypothetical protein
MKRTGRAVMSALSRVVCVDRHSAVIARLDRATIFDGERQAQLIALACSKPPPGYARWTLRLLADTVVEREIVAAASTR